MNSNGSKIAKDSEGLEKPWKVPESMKNEVDLMGDVLAEKDQQRGINRNSEKINKFRRRSIDSQALESQEFGLFLPFSQEKISLEQHELNKQDLRRLVDNLLDRSDCEEELDDDPDFVRTMLTLLEWKQQENQSKSVRTCVYTRDQLERLAVEFEKNPKPSDEKIRILAEELQLEVDVVERYFVRKRERRTIVIDE